jgi:hypothetical protein
LTDLTLVVLPALVPLTAMPASAVRRQLDRLRIVAIADFLLLVALLIAAFSDAEGAVNVLGPVHGVGYLLQLYLCARGAGEGWWGWWFPALVVVTLGPPGSLIGDLRVRRSLTAAASRP